MSWFEEVKPFFLVARACGLAPYTYVNGLPCESTSWKIYAYLCIVARISENFVVPYVVGINKDWNLKLIIFVLAESVMTSSSLIIETFTSTRCYDKLKKVIDLVDNYDQSVRFNFPKKSFQSWSIMALPVIYIGCLRAVTSEDTISDKLNEIRVMIEVTSWFTMVLKFTAVMNSLERRFLHLGNLMTKVKRSMIYEKDGSERPLRLNDVFRLHNDLMAAAKTFNSIHNVALFIWIVESTLYATTRIYESFTASSETSELATIGLTVAKSIPDVTILVYLFSCCQRVSDAANKVGYMALSPRSWVIIERQPSQRDEIFTIGQYFILNPLQITAGYGFFNVQLSLLGTIIGAMTTILVFLSN